MVQPMNTRSSASFLSEKAFWKISLILHPCIDASQLHSGSNLQATYKLEQKKIACVQSSSHILQFSQSADVVIFLRNKFRFVGKASLHAHQTKFFTLLGTSIPQRFFQNSIPLVGVCCTSELSFKNL